MDPMGMKKIEHAIKQTESDLDDARVNAPGVGDPPVNWDRAAWFGSRLRLSSSGAGGVALTSLKGDQLQLKHNVTPDTTSLDADYGTFYLDDNWKLKKVKGTTEPAVAAIENLNEVGDIGTLTQTTGYLKKVSGVWELDTTLTSSTYNDDSVKALLKTLDEEFWKGVQGLKDLVDNAIKAAKDALDALITGINEVLDVIGRTVEEVWNNIVDWVTAQVSRITDFATKVWESLTSDGEWLKDQVWKGFTATVTWLKENIWDTTKAIFKSFWDWLFETDITVPDDSDEDTEFVWIKQIRNIVKEVAKTVLGTVQFMIEFWKKLFSSILDQGTLLLDLGLQTASTFWNWLFNLTGNDAVNWRLNKSGDETAEVYWLRTLRAWLKPVYTSVQSGIDAAWAFISDVGNSVWNWILGLGKPATKTNADDRNWLKILHDALKSIGKSATDLWSVVTKFWDSIVENNTWFKNFKGIFEGILASVTGLSGLVARFWTQLTTDNTWLKNLETIFKTPLGAITSMSGLVGVFLNQIFRDNTWLNNFKTTFQSIFASATTFSALAKKTWDQLIADNVWLKNFATIFSSLVGPVGTTVSGMVTAIWLQLTSDNRWLKNFETIFDGITNNVNTFAGLVQRFWTKLTTDNVWLKNFANIFDNITDSVTSFSGLVTEFWNQIVEDNEWLGQVKDLLDNTATQIQNALKGASSNLKTALETLRDKLGGLGALFGIPAPEGGTSPNTGATTGDIDVKTFDLRRVDRIFFDSNDPLGGSQVPRKPIISGHSDTLTFSVEGKKGMFFVQQRGSRFWMQLRSNTSNSNPYPKDVNISVPLWVDNQLRIGSFATNTDLTKATPGVFWLDGSDIKCYTGSKEVSLSDIGTGGGSTPTPTIPTRRSRLPVQVFSGTPSTANLDSWFGSGNGAAGIVVTTSNPTSASQVRIYVKLISSTGRDVYWISIPFGSYLGRRGSDTSVASNVTIITYFVGSRTDPISSLTGRLQQGLSSGSADGRLGVLTFASGSNQRTYFCVINKSLTYPPYSGEVFRNIYRRSSGNITQIGTSLGMPNTNSLPNENASTLDQYFGGGRDNGAMGISVDTLYVKVRGRWFALGLNYDGPRPGTGSGEFEGGDVPNPTTFKSLVTFEGGVSGITGGGSNTPTYTSVSSQPNAPSPI